MIIKKPYAFLIKNFRKIHILLFIISLYIYYKTTQLYSFVNEFIKLETYNSYSEPISKYINVITIVLLVFLIIASAIIIRLLRRKDKPWKLYLIPVFQYSLLILTSLIVRNFFQTYTGVESTTYLRAWRDILLISQLGQFLVFIVYIIRIFGVDLNKFNFKVDEEYLELEQRDREEFEININIDKNAIKRTYRRILRNINYYYQEHKFMARVIILVFLLITGFSTYRYISSHKAYKQGTDFSVNGYTVKINNSYYSDKAYNGEVISKKSAFVIVNLTITNNSVKRTVDLNKYHIINGIDNSTHTEMKYAKEFQDLGNTYTKLTLKQGDSRDIILIFKVNKKLDVNRFVLYYQEFNKKGDYLRKIKLNLKDVSKIEDKAVVERGQKLSFVIKNEEEDIYFHNYTAEIEPTYSYRSCGLKSCTIARESVLAQTGYVILKIPFGSIYFEGIELQKFAAEYGKIVYNNMEGKEVSQSIVSPIKREFDGKYIYIQIPAYAVDSEKLDLVFTIRNNRYTCKLK